MAQPTELTMTGRQNLDVPPAPTTPPEAAPRISQLGNRPEGNALSIGSLQQSAVIFQTGMAVEKGLIALANLLPDFAQAVQQIIPQVREGIRTGIAAGNAAAPAPGAGGAELPAQAVSPLQQG